MGTWTNVIFYDNACCQELYHNNIMLCVRTRHVCVCVCVCVCMCRYVVYTVIHSQELYYTIQ